MRGKVLSLIQRIQNSRITPAYAGKSLNCLICKTYIGDHPRLCGEKELAIQNFLQMRGSPPPMRGKVQIYFYMG